MNTLGRFKEYHKNELKNAGFGLGAGALAALGANQVSKIDALRELMFKGASEKKAPVGSWLPTKAQRVQAMLTGGISGAYIGSKSFDKEKFLSRFSPESLDEVRSKAAPLKESTLNILREHGTKGLIPSMAKRFFNINEGDI